MSVSDREQLRLDFLAAAGLAEAARAPLPGDASTRRYERLTPPGGPTLMLMDQAPAAESPPADPAWTPEQRHAAGWNAVARLSAGRIEAFVACAGHLRAQGLSAPLIHAADPAQGLAVLEDLGDDLFVHKVTGGMAEAELYGPAIDALVRLHETAPPSILQADGQSWPLLTYDDLALKTGCNLFLEWWPKFAKTAAYSDDAAAEWEDLWAPIRARGEAGASVFTHRDYHAENLLWLAQRQGVARVGMIDFQDALRAHPAWDLLSLLQDARRDIDPALEAAMLERYFAARPGVDRQAFLRDYRGLAALNASRILFIFARQVAGFGKPRYVDFMPRTWRYLERNLADPAMAPLRAWFDRHVPDEARA